jgi:hypothetical protein
LLPRSIFALPLGVLFTLANIGIAFANAPAPTCAPSDCTIQAWFEDTNHEPYWENTYFASRHYECTKVNEASTPVATTQAHDVLIIKAGQYNYIFGPASAGNYSAGQTTSHWFYCDGPEQEQLLIDPQGAIGGPCNDPAYYGVFDNTGSTMPIRFRLSWRNNAGLQSVAKWVPAGAIYRTWEHWAKPGTLVKVSYKNPETGLFVDAATLVAVHGWYPPCVYRRGFEFPAS